MLRAPISGTPVGEGAAVDDRRNRNKAVIEAHARALDSGDVDAFAATHAEDG